MNLNYFDNADTTNLRRYLDCHCGRNLRDIKKKKQKNTPGHNNQLNRVTMRVFICRQAYGHR